VHQLHVLKDEEEAPRMPVAVLLVEEQMDIILKEAFLAITTRQRLD